MSVRFWLSLGASLSILAACATQQENPNYTYSTKYKAGEASSGYTTTPASYTQGGTQAGAPINYQGSNYQGSNYQGSNYQGSNYQGGATTSYASSTPPTSGAYTRVDESCLRKEQNRELLGAGLGGTIGAIAGRKIIGGTAGTVIGAGLGGTAGYGIGDISVNCDPQTFVMQSPQSSSLPSYQTPQVVTQQSYSVPATHQATTQQYASTNQGHTVYESPRVVHQAPTDSQFRSISDTGTPGYQVLQSQRVVQAAPISGAQRVDYDYTENVVSANAATIAGYSSSRQLSSGFQQSHIVSEGDTVYSLARKNCVGVNDIQSLNGLDSSFAIKIGENLNLPSSKC